MDSLNKFYRLLNDILFLHPSATPDLAAILKMATNNSFMKIFRLGFISQNNVSIHKLIFIK